MFKILEAYCIPQEIVDAIKIMCTNTSATVITPEGLTDLFSINTDVSQGDPLAPFLFIICLDYALHKAINQYDGITLKRRMSSRHSTDHLADLGYADDIALFGDTVPNAQDLLIKVELACQALGLNLHAPKTKYMRFNSTTNE